MSAENRNYTIPTIRELVEMGVAMEDRAKLAEARVVELEPAARASSQNMGAMRRRSEIEAVLSVFEKINASVEQPGETLGDDVDRMAAFNRNSLIVCALQWVLGKDTLKVSL